VCFVFSEGEFVSKWFIGLMFTKSEGVNVNLTYDIQNFTDIGNFASFACVSFVLRYFVFCLAVYLTDSLVLGS